MRTWILSILIAACTLTGLSGCAVVVGGAASGAAIVHDRRTAGTILDDQSIEFNSKRELRKDEQLRKLAHIVVTSFNNIVLLSGQAPNTVLKQRAAKIVSSIAKVRHIHNELQIAAPSSLFGRTGDSLTTAKVKAAMVGLEGLEDFDTTRVKVVTENGVVFLMGLLKRRESSVVTEEVRRISGVQRVVKLFEYID